MPTQISNKHTENLFSSTGTACGSLFLALLVVTSLSYAHAQDLGPLTFNQPEHNAHIFPTPSEGLRLQQIPPGGAVSYRGGPVMLSATTYAIFWIPATGLLQDGRTGTSMSAHYQLLQKNLLAQYAGHGIDNNNTQYYDIVNGVTQYINNLAGLGGVYVETRAYPVSGCTDPVTGINCLSQTEVQNEVGHAMALNGWSGGLNKIFLVFTSSGEGSCLPDGGCAYSNWCGYHSDFIYNGATFIYANIPYADPRYCQIPDTPSPNNDPAADAAANVVSHELTEAITDPIVGTGWTASSGAEIGDLCAWLYGTNTWDNNQANQMWSGVFFELQTEYDNHSGNCVQVGPWSQPIYTSPLVSQDQTPG